MIAPIDYSINVQSPFETALQGAKLGAGIAEIQAVRQQKELALQQQQQMQSDLNALAAKPNPTAADYAVITTKYPQLADKFKASWEMQDESQKQAKMSNGMQVYAALQAGKPDIARSILSDQALAYRNSGNEDEAKAAETASKLIEINPQAALSTAGLYLSSVMGPDKFADTMAKLGGEQREQTLFPSKQREAIAKAGQAESEATTKGVQAKYAEQDALADLEKKGWDVKNIQSEIGYRKEQNRIAAMNAAANREGNALKRQELGLKIQEAQQMLNDKVRAKVADAESAAASIDNMLNTIKRVQAHPALKDVVGSIEGREFYPNTLAAAATTAVPGYGFVSTSGDERTDAIKLIETLGSQAFLAQVPAMKGQGSLSNAEGEKLQAALTNLSRAQSEKQFNANLDDAARILTKARGVVSKRYGVPLGNPDMPSAAPTNRPPLSSFGGQ